MVGKKVIRISKWRNQYIYIIILVLLSLSVFIYSRITKDRRNIDHPNNQIVEGSMLVHYIDVGQGDCMLIQDGTYNILIDTASSRMSEKVLTFLYEHDVDSIDMIVLTHPHEDHIGSFSEIAMNYEIDLVLKSPVERDNYTYIRTENTIEDMDIKSIIPYYGEVFRYGDMMFTVISDSALEYDEINDYSVVLRLDHKGNTFIFTGDMESDAEHSILEKDVDLECDVLKVAHHGGSSSTTSAFLYETSPIYAIIQLGADNEYGYPHRTLLSRLDIHDIITYRNDLLGDITVISTVNGLSFEFEKDVRYDSD